MLTEALALVGGPVNIDLSADDSAKWHKHLSKLSITKLLRQMVDEEITALWASQHNCGTTQPPCSIVHIIYWTRQSLVNS